MAPTPQQARPFSTKTFGIALGLALGASLSAGAQTAPVACEDLASVSAPSTVISSSAVVAPGGLEVPSGGGPGAPIDPSSLPAFCRVKGSIRPTTDSDIQFELWLPTADAWNGRFLQTGNGGAAGSIVHRSLVDPLKRGYAVANTDTGHQGAGGDFAWAVGHPEKLVDYQYRAVHELTVVGKALTAAHYGKRPEKSYWYGCSTGGRQGLKEAQRFPDDYDAIVAGAPANNWSALMSLSTLIQTNLGPGGLGVGKLRALKEAAIAACDATDRVTDRVIGDPGRCDFDPSSLACADDASGPQCLTSSEVEAARRIYAGLVDGQGEVLMPGTGPGSEPVWAAYTSPGFSIGTNYFRNLVLGDPDWDPEAFDVDVHVELAERYDGGAAKAMDPDLSAFLGRDGKLLLYHGTTDGLIPYGNTVRYFEDVVETVGADAVEQGVRLYLVPGMDHCSGGEGAYAVDWLSALEGWVERGEAPSRLTAERPATGAGSSAFTRPVCPFPQLSRYTGKGSRDEASSFGCVARGVEPPGTPANR